VPHILVDTIDIFLYISQSHTWCAVTSVKLVALYVAQVVFGDVRLNHALPFEANLDISSPCDPLLVSVG
jgi:hypothetical protein